MNDFVQGFIMFVGFSILVSAVGVALAYIDYRREGYKNQRGWTFRDYLKHTQHDSF